MTASRMLARYLAALISPITIGRPEFGPLNLDLLACRLGARDVTYRAAILAGFTDWSGDGPIIQIGLSRSEGRRRATLAHECGHLILDPILETPAYQCASSSLMATHEARIADLLAVEPSTIRRKIQSVNIETLCDKVAIEFMLPESVLSTLISQVRDLRTLLDAASRWRVSLAMLTNRLADVGEDYTLLRMVPTKAESWVCASASGLRTRNHGFIEWLNPPKEIGTRRHIRQLNVTLAYRDTVQTVAAETFSTGHQSLLLLRSFRAIHERVMASGAKPGSPHASEYQRMPQIGDS